MSIQVFIIETLFENDPTEGEQIQEALAQDGISSTLRTTRGKLELLECLTAAQKQLGLDKNLVPCLHLSAHGNPQGIGVPRSWGIAWEEMMEVLAGINKAVGGRLILCMSTCEGLRGWKMNLIHKPLPFSVLVGSEELIHSDVAVAGFTAFYQAKAAGKSVKQSINAMKAKSQCVSFMAVFDKEILRIEMDVRRAGARGFDALNDLRRRYGLEPFPDSFASRMPVG